SSRALPHTPPAPVTPSLLVLALANAVPIVGVLFLGWQVFPIVLLYWLENVVVGAFNAAKLLLARPQETLSNVGKLFLVPFFMVHFAMFTFVLGVLLVALFGPKMRSRAASWAPSFPSGAALR
ncbi:MAG: DUF6498-containing protein, partial [bacterium]